MASAAATAGAHAAAAGISILSGFQTHEEREVIAAFRGASLVERFEEDSWVAVTLRKDE